jgi:hypothetical protein
MGKLRLISAALGACAILAVVGCDGGVGSSRQGSPPAGSGSGLTPSSIDRIAAMTMPHYVARPQHPDHGLSWMRVNKSGPSHLFYISDWATDDVFVYAYPSGKLEGQLTGFQEPYGQCADAKANIWIANFGGSTIVQYAHGGTSPLATLTTNGAAIGCAVSPNRDLAVADFSTVSGPGNIQVFVNGSGTATNYSNSSCYYLWPPGYDNKGNLYVEAESESGTPQVCELPANGTSLAPVAFNHTITSPGSTMWDGKYIAFTDQEEDGTQTTGIYRAIAVRKGGLKYHSATRYDDTCDGTSDYVDIPQPFIVGPRNTPVNKDEGTVVIGGNILCANRFNYWSYPDSEGGEPIVELKNAPAQPYGAAFSTLNKVNTNGTLERY